MAASTPFKTRLQQQPQRFVDRQQQQSSGSREFQPRGFRFAASLPSSQMGAGQVDPGALSAAREPS